MNTEPQVLNVPIEDIIPNRFQPRLNFDENSLKELASSIKEHGIIQPLVLRRLNDKYEIIAGERRYKAAKLAGLTSVPAIISQMDDNTSAEIAIVENIQRKDLTSIEEAKSYKTLLDKGYLTQEELAKKMGLSQSAVSNKLRLLSLSEAVQNAVMEGKISERHARSLLQLDTEQEQNNWLRRIIDERLTVRDLDKKLKELKGETGTTDDIPIITNDPNIQAIKANAIDLFSNNENSNSTIQNTQNENNINKENEKIPNKFFNFLEDEQVNMNVHEQVNNEEPVVNNNEPAIDLNTPLNELQNNEPNTVVNPNSTVQPDINMNAPASPVMPENQNNLNNIDPNTPLSDILNGVDTNNTTDVNNETNNIEVNLDTPVVNENNNNESEVENQAPQLDLDVKVEDTTNNDAVEEEVELLDFAPEIPKVQEEPNINTNIQNNGEVNLDKANELINKLEDDLRENNYRISIVKENDTKEYRYIITIDKEL